MTRVLISSLSPLTGGVSAMMRTAIQLLSESGYESTVAWYEPYSWTPRLSVPLFRLGSRSVSSEPRDVPGTAGGRALGAWLPELEFTHYWATSGWRELIARHELHLVVSGTALAGVAFAQTKTPFLAWLASDWSGDRDERARRFPAHRRLIDRTVVQPVARRLERRVLRSGHVVALSSASRRALDRTAGETVVRDVLPAPIDLDLLHGSPERVVPGKIAFMGRFSDPRKNFALFLDAVARMSRSGHEVSAEIIGGVPDAAQLAAVESRGIADRIRFRGFVPREELASVLGAMDVLVVTSHQEGLGIAALEAMACGCPVVATRCGGPQEFVRDGQNGCSTGFDPEEIAARTLEIVADRELRSRLGAGARRTVETSYSWLRVREIFAAQFESFRTSSQAEEES